MQGTNTTNSVSQNRGRKRIFTRTSFFAFTALLLLLSLTFYAGLSVFDAPSSSAVTTVPTKMNFQGRLTDSTGNIKPNGTYNMRFKLYTVATAGTNVWAEDRLVSATQGVTVTNGLFSVQLGSVTALPASLFASGTLYLEVELPTPATATSASPTWSEGAMTPRNQMATSAYAYNSETLDGQDGDYYLNAGNLTGTVSAARLSGSYTSITGTGALAAGSIASGFGTIATGNTISGTTLNGTTGINTGAGAGTQRIDASGNLVNVGNIAANGSIMFNGNGVGTYDNFIDNPGYETGNEDQGWVNNAAFTLESTDTRTGNYAVNATSTGANFYYEHSADIPTQAGENWYGEVWMKSIAAAGQGSIRFAWYQKTGVASAITPNTYPGLAATTADTWTKLSGTATAPSDAAFLRIFIRIGTGSTGVVHKIDDVYVTKEPDLPALSINGTNVITTGRLLQNVTTDASILTTGTIASARLSGSYTGITGTGALAVGSIASGFGTISTSNTISGTQLISTVTTGTAPLTIASTTKVTSLNADLLDGLDSTAFGDATAANQTTILNRIGTNADAAGTTTVFARLASIDTSKLGATGDAASSTGSIFARLAYLIVSIGATTDAASSTGSVNAKLAYIIANSGGASMDVQTFDTSGTWTKPAGAKKVEVQVWSGGGGGSRVVSSGSGYYYAGGGGGGGFAEGEFNASDISSSVTVTIGAGGLGGFHATNALNTYQNGTSGGVSSFGSYLDVPKGGEGGAWSDADTPANGYGGAGGGFGWAQRATNTVNNSPQEWDGGSGGYSVGIKNGAVSIFGGGGGGTSDNVANSSSNQGTGGSSVKSGGNGGTGGWTANGGDGQIPAGGGGGVGNTNNNGAVRGGNGASGRVVVITYF